MSEMFEVKNLVINATFATVFFMLCVVIFDVLR